MSSGAPAGRQVLLLDNYDSFTWNLAQYLGELGARVEVVRNDETTPDEVAAAAFDAIVVSPGPGRPEGAGITLDLVRRLSGEVPLLGVCLGHQAIAQAFGAEIVSAPTLMHGKTSPILHDGRSIYRGLPLPFEATRYHSLVVDKATLPEILRPTAHTPDGVLMGLRHRDWPLEGVQFHPESVLTPDGRSLLKNFLDLAVGTACR